MTRWRLVVRGLKPPSRFSRFSHIRHDGHFSRNSGLAIRAESFNNFSPDLYRKVYSQSVAPTPRFHLEARYRCSKVTPRSSLQLPPPLFPFPIRAHHA